MSKILEIQQTVFPKTRQECVDRQEAIYLLFEKECKKIKSEYNPNTVGSFRHDMPYPKIDFVISHNKGKNTVWIVGTKRAGSEHDMNEWKKTPIFSCEIMELHDNDHMLDFALNYGEPIDRNGPTNLPDWKCNETVLIRKMKLALKNAVYHFIEIPKNTI